ncbi:MAG: molecular chaperone SurA [Betaproteobacteria bacterium RBG_16_66_20]|nr:MAG: molecular chaperone SurA [Betaproteobacteria bacterium RBG_16_66_20]
MRILLALVVLCACGLAQAQTQAPARTQTQGQVPAPRQAARQPQRVVLVDRIVAIVGREVVTASELGERREFAERQLQGQGTPLPERGILERQILERLILDKAQLQLAKESGIRVEEIQLDRALERVAENNRMTLTAFRQALEKDGVPFEKFRDEVRQQIQMQRLREREVDDRIEVSESEIDNFLAEARGGDSRSEYSLAHVLVRLPEQASPEQIEVARKKAEKARAESAAGTDFAKIAASYSDASDAMQGGMMGWRAEDRLPEIFGATVRGMKAGETSAVLRSAGGFHVVKLLARRGAEDGTLIEQTRARHILIRTNEAVSESDARRRLTDLRERIVTGGADFAELAKLHSADGSAARGGDLDWLLPGDTVPEFERVMASLKPGEISQPFKTPFGWHIAQVLERRAAGLTQDRRRFQARQALKERKADEAYQEWLRQLRDRTYVEMRLEDR